jgi:hypothetical protein
MTASPICKSCFAVAAWTIHIAMHTTEMVQGCNTTGVVQVQTRTVLPQN